ncbi:DUF2061 domain-containing protein [Wenzhouxiangella sp. 15181]|nr:DUF2061 domain-containing protein [Wenzhouxiangella sp. 15181]RFP69750.1 DUF2061 domain-containing protein [Wenzhouxiangella sp. 15190]
MASRKTVTFAIMHMSVAFAVVYLLTGSLALGGAVAMIEPAVNTIAYFFHEKVWERFGFRTSNNPGRSAPPAESPMNDQAPRPVDPIARCLQCQWRARNVPGSRGGAPA